MSCMENLQKKKKHKFYKRKIYRDNAETREKNIMKQLINWEDNNVMAHVMLEKEANTHLSVRGWVLFILNIKQQALSIRRTFFNLFSLLFYLPSMPLLQVSYYCFRVLTN